MKKYICLTSLVLLLSLITGYVGYSYAQRSIHEYGTARFEDVKVGKSFWTQDSKTMQWRLNNGGMPTYSEHVITAIPAEPDTLPAGYYERIIIRKP